MAHVSLFAVSKISWLLLASVAEQEFFQSYWSQTPNDRFSRDLAHIEHNNFLSWRSAFDSWARSYENVSYAILAISKVSRLQLAFVAEQAGLNLTGLQSPKTHFRVTWLNFFLWICSAGQSACHKKTCLGGLQPGKTQTGLRSYRS